MGSEPVNSPQRPKAKWTIDSEAMRARGMILCFSKIQLVGQKYRDKTTLSSKTRFSHHCFGFQSQCFSQLVGYNIQPSSSSTNQNVALIIDQQLDFTKTQISLVSNWVACKQADLLLSLGGGCWGCYGTKLNIKGLSFLYFFNHFEIQ